MQLRTATREKVKLRLGISGPSGSGKTYSALLLASGITSWDKIAVIDTENGRGDLYAHLGPYNVITLNPPYAPERFIKAIEECEKAGMDVIIIDSISHEWEGKGGILQLNEQIAQTRFKGNTWSAWSVTTPRHQAFIEAIVDSGCHIITTARSKIETVYEGGKVKKLGMKEIQREGFEYELTVNFNLDRDTHFATASKDNTEIFENLDPFTITRETGEILKEWCNAGKVPTSKSKVQNPKTEPEAESPKGTASAEGARPILNKLQRELAKRGAKSAKEALDMLNAVLGEAELEHLPDFDISEDSAGTAYMTLMKSSMKPKASPKKKTESEPAPTHPAILAEAEAKAASKAKKK